MIEFNYDVMLIIISSTILSILNYPQIILDASRLNKKTQNLLRIGLSFSGRTENERHLHGSFYKNF